MNMKKVELKSELQKVKVGEVNSRPSEPSKGPVS